MDSLKEFFLNLVLGIIITILLAGAIFYVFVVPPLIFSSALLPIIKWILGCVWISSILAAVIVAIA